MAPVECRVPQDHPERDERGQQPEKFTAVRTAEARVVDIIAAADEVGPGQRRTT